LGTLFALSESTEAGGIAATGTPQEI